MSQRIEYVTPNAIEFRNELDLAEIGVEDPHDQDVLVIHYDEIIVIPGGYDAQYELAETIRRTIKAQTGKDGRAVRTGDQLTPTSGRTRDQLYSALLDLCQNYGRTTDHTLDLLDNVIDSLDTVTA